MRSRFGPYFLLTILAILLFFIVGVRYGQRVEKENKKISYLLSLAPTKTVSPTEVPLQFRTYSHADCAIQFLYPSLLKLEKETSTSATFVKNKKVEVSFSCEKENPLATKSGQLLLKKLNPLTGRFVYFVVSQELYPLLDSSVKFSAPK